MIRPSNCPICKRMLPAGAVAGSDEAKYFPFCSERCRLVDLHRWSSGKYAIIDPLDPEQLDTPMMADDPDQFGDDFPNA